MNNIYLPTSVKITEIKEQSSTVKSFKFTPTEASGLKKNDQGIVFNPGQFVLIGNIGYGEAPFGISSSPYEDNFMEIVVRKVGTVTSYLHNLKKGDLITMRGPYGNGFPVGFMEGKDIVMATGGCGIPPIAATIEYIIANREKFGRTYVLYGAKSPEEILMKDKIEEWKQAGISVILTIDKPADNWDGSVGFVSDLVKEIKIDEADAVALMCGPGPMMDALEKIFRPLGISDRRIFVNMERKMQCGVGKCQHCTCGSNYVCMDGPVFNYDEIEKSWD